MPVTFYGKWSLAVTAISEAPVQQRVRIAGSIANDGSVPGNPGQGIAVIDGTSWQAYLEWSGDEGVTWLESNFERMPGVTPQDGLIVTLRADIFEANISLGGGKEGHVAQNFPNALDAKFNYLNRKINPAGPNPAGYGYTLPAGSFWPQRPIRKQPACCACYRQCTCGRRPVRLRGTER